MKETEKNIIELCIIKEMYVDKIVNLALSRFKWENLPSKIDASFIERQLLTTGKLAFFYETELEEFLCLPFTYGGNIDQYGNPTRIQANGLNGYTKETSNFCVIWDNLLRYNSMSFIEYYANKLAQIDKTSDINLNAQKTPVIITAPENAKLTVKNFAMQYSTFNTEIFCYNNLKDNLPLKTLNLESPYLLDKLREEKKQVMQEMLEHCGVLASTNKKERMLTDEITNQNGAVTANITSKFLARQQACAKINETYGLNISIEIME